MPRNDDERVDAICQLMKKPDPPELHRGHVLTLNGDEEAQRWWKGFLSQAHTQYLLPELPQSWESH